MLYLCRRVLLYVFSQEVFLPKELNQESAFVVCHCGKVLLDAGQYRDTFFSVALITLLIQFVSMSLVNENNKKLYSIAEIHAGSG